MENKNITESLAQFVVDSRMEDFPAEVIVGSKKCLLDWMGVAFGGMKDPSIRIMIDLIKEMGGKRQASVLGYGMKTNVLNAALMNGLMGKIKARANPSLKEGEANIKVRLKNGMEFSREVFFPKGDPRNPLSFDEIEEKFRDLVRPVLSKKRMDQIVEMIQELESLEDVAKLLKICRFTYSPAG